MNDDQIALILMVLLYVRMIAAEFVVFTDLHLGSSLYIVHAIHILSELCVKYILLNHGVHTFFFLPKMQSPPRNFGH
jgi:hypothetical protein